MIDYREGKDAASGRTGGLDSASGPVHEPRAEVCAAERTCGCTSQRQQVATDKGCEVSGK